MPTNINSNNTINDGRASSGQVLPAGTNDILDASLGSQAGGTHLSTSLKDLQKIGVDAVSAVGNVSIDLGAGVTDGGVPLDVGSLPVFGKLNDDGSFTLDGDAANVTLNVSDLNGLEDVTSSASGLVSAGVDAVELRLADVDLSQASIASTVSNDIASLSGAGLDVSVHVNQDQAQSMITDGLKFVDGGVDSAGAVHTVMDANGATQAGGTHLSTSLKDLHTLGIDTVRSNTSNVELNLGSGSALDADDHLPVFDEHLNVTLDVARPQLDEIVNLQSVLHDSGIDSIALSSSDIHDSSAITQIDWNQNDLSLMLKINDSQTLNTDFVHNSNAGNAHTVLSELLGGTDVLGTLTGEATFGDLIEALHESGLGRIEIDAPTQQAVHISDDLASALADSGMLSALPQANVLIDAQSNFMSSSLKTLADLGVDGVTSSGKVYVGLGSDIHVNELHNILASFTGEQPIFNHGAGLVVDQDAFTQLSADEAKDLLAGLHKLGIDEVDVVSKVGDANHVDVHAIDVVAQTPVTVIGSAEHLNADDFANLLHLDILHKKI